MLQEYKQIYQTQADKIKDWKTLDKNELCNAYVNASDTDKEKYLSAIICRYWNNIQKMYNKGNGQLSEEDCYDLFIESILYVLNHRRWLDEDSSLYGDPKAPDKMINVSLRTIIVTKFQELNKQKRKANMNATSIEALQELYNDYYQPFDDEFERNLSELYIADIIKAEFRKKNYFNAFVIFQIVYNEHSDRKNPKKLDINKVTKHILEMNDMSCEQFSKRYDIDIIEVKEALRICKSICCSYTNKELRNITKNILNLIKNAYNLK